MQERFDTLIDSVYNINNPMPIVSVTRIHVELPEGSTYMGAFEIVNSGEGTLTGVIESLYGWVYIEETSLKKNQQAITYRVAGDGLTGENYEDAILITYNGGEILIPVLIHVQKRPVPVLEKSVSYQAIPIDFTFELSKRSYSIEDAGTLSIINHTQKPATIRMIGGENAVTFREHEVVMKDYAVLEFTFKLSKIDRILSRIPLRTNPECEVSFQVEILQEGNKKVKTVSLLLTEYKAFKAPEVVGSHKEYRTLLANICKAYRDMTLFHSEVSYEDLLNQLDIAMEYDRTNITLRLFHCYLGILKNRKKAVMDEIEQIDHYIIYYDKINSDVSDLLMLFLDLAGGTHPEGRLKGWRALKRENWPKILLKNRILPIGARNYSDYKKLYQLGVKNNLVFIEATHYLNHNPFIPLEEDGFYRVVLRWALNHGVLGMKWVRKLESNIYTLVRYQLVDEGMAEKLYALSGHKNILGLLCNIYIDLQRRDEKAHEIFKQALGERLHVNKLEDAYIMTAYECRHPLDMDLFKMIYQPNHLEQRYLEYFFLHLLLYKAKAKSLYHFHEKEIAKLKGAHLPLELILTGQDLITYLEYLMLSKQMDQLTAYYQMGRLKEVPEELLLSIILEMGKHEPKQASAMALWAFKSLGYYNPDTLTLACPVYKGPLSNMIAFYYLQKQNQCNTDSLMEQILYKGILTKKYPEEILEILQDYIRLHDAMNPDWLVKYLSAQILTQDYMPTSEVLEILEKSLAKDYQMPYALAYLKGSIQNKSANNVLTSQWVQNFIKEDILFPWFDQIIPMKQLGERLGNMVCFEHSSAPNQEVVLYYRLEDESIFRAVPMKHIGLGLYCAHLLLFFNEELQYYIEVGSEYSKEIAMSDVYVQENSMEPDDTQTLLNCTNTVLMSLNLDDEVSLEQTIEHYLKYCKKEIEQIGIL